jgi:acyl-CoA hydrolase
VRACVNKDYKISICCFFAKHVALRRKSKDWLARNQGNVSEWGDMLTRGLNPTKRIGLVQSITLIPSQPVFALSP